MSILNLLFLGIFLFILDSLMFYFIERRCAKKAKYNCEDCRAWSCTRYYCLDQKKKLENKEVEKCQL